MSSVVNSYTSRAQILNSRRIHTLIRTRKMTFSSVRTRTCPAFVHIYKPCVLARTSIVLSVRIPPRPACPSCTASSSSRSPRRLAPLLASAPRGLRAQRYCPIPRRDLRLHLLPLQRLHVRASHTHTACPDPLLQFLVARLILDSRWPS